MGSSFGNQIFQGTNPSEQYQHMEAENATLASNSLEDAIRQNQIAAGKETVKQEALKSEELNHAWQAHKAYAGLMAKHTKLSPAEGYYEGSDPNSAGAPVAGSAPSSPGVQSGSSNAIAPAMDAAANASADIGTGGMAGVPPPKKRMDPNNPATYKVDVDHDAVIKGMTAAGYGPEALKEDDARKAALIKTVELYTKQHALAVQKYKGMADMLAAVTPTNFNEPDPAELQRQRQASETGAVQQLHRGVQLGIFDREQAQQVERDLSGGGWNPQMQQMLTQMAKGATAAKDQNEQAMQEGAHHLAALTGESLKKERDSQAKERDQTTLTKGLGNAAQTAEGITDQASMDNWYKRQTPAVQEAVGDVYKRGYSQATVDKIKAMGRTEENRTKDAETKYQHDVLNSQKDERQSWLEATKQQGKQQDKAQAGRDYTALTKLQADERKLYPVRSRLAEQIQLADQGKPFEYIQERGTVTPSSKIMEDDDKKAAIADMRERYKATTESLKEVINQKYDITKDTGKVSRADALAAVEGKGAKPAATTKQPAPAEPERNGKDTGKTLDAKNPEHVAKAREYLQKAGGDKDKARALAKADGYTF